MHFEDGKEDNDGIPGEALVQTVTLLAPGGGWGLHTVSLRITQNLIHILHEKA